VNSEPERRRKEAVVAQFGVLLSALSCEANVDTKNLNQELWSLRRGLEPEPYEYEVGLSPT
jgi:hypothetical protein